MKQRVHTAPPDSGVAVLGKSLPQILSDAVDRFGSGPTFSQRRDGAWQTLHLDEFARRSDRLALGLRALGLRPGDRVALFMDSDVDFCMADMGCLTAGLVDVPIYTTHADGAIRYVIEHAGVRALITSRTEDAQRIGVLCEGLSSLEFLVSAAVDWDPNPDSGVRSIQSVEALGAAVEEREPEAARLLRGQADASALATIIYTSGTTGVPKGVMLSHENISSNGLTAFSGLRGYQAGASEEVAISFLPLTHVFARTLHYGYLAYGTNVYFVLPDELGDFLKEVKPTVFASVPRVLEKVYTRVVERGASMTGARKRLFDWSMALARQYQLGIKPTGWYGVQLRLASRLVFSKWREALGGRVKFIISGGAALNGDLANVFGAAGVNILQGYGLTETSPVITYNRPDRNRAFTVGVPIPAVEVRVADDGEILTRGPHIMLGYYREAAKTAEVIDEQGWFHTGDIGEFDRDGYLRITDRKKDLFKLSTGKYVMPQPLENKLAGQALVEQAVVTGNGQPFCTALIFPAESALRTYARLNQIDDGLDLEALCREPKVLARFQALVDEANEGMAPWSTIKRFRLVADQLSVDNGLLTPTLKAKRSKVQEVFARVIDDMYLDHQTPLAASDPPVDRA